METRAHAWKFGRNEKLRGNTSTKCECFHTISSFSQTSTRVSITLWKHRKYFLFPICQQPRSQGFSLFVIGKAGKGPGTGRSHDFQHPDIVGVINYNNND